MDVDHAKMYPFHRANIHEERWAAYLVRAAPMGAMVLTLALALFGVLRCTSLLLVICAALNVTMWMWICSTSIFCILGAYTVKELVIHCRRSDETEKAKREDGSVENHVPADESQERVRHLIVLPNYKEDEEMLAESLESLREARGSKDFWVVLAMEAREGKDATDKAERLKERWGSSFSNFMATFHPGDLEEEHLDGTRCPEVPGKASNLKWGVAKAYQACLADPSVSVANVVLTVADADVLFHPHYFSYISNEFSQMREAPGEQQRWTMWQAPQLPFRNYYVSPIPARVWGYVSSIFEFGGVSSLSAGGHHMVFSAYSLSLQLGVDAELWDGDIIAEDHHAYLKCFFYSVRSAAIESLTAEKEGRLDVSCKPKLRVRPVMLPVKSTSVVSSEGYLQSWVDRWNQATRHCQGVAELSYALLCTWDLLCTLPVRAYNVQLVFHLLKVISKCVFMHIIPNIQAIALGVLTMVWLWNHRLMPQCPKTIVIADPDSHTLLCGLAGAWVLTWPVVIPFSLVAFANFMFFRATFLEPAMTSRKGGKANAGPLSIWHGSDGGVLPTLGSKSLTVGLHILLDCVLFVGPVMVPYGLIAELSGCWNVLTKGNRFKYVTATKMMGEGYGTMNKSDAVAK